MQDLSLYERLAGLFGNLIGWLIAVMVVSGVIFALPVYLLWNHSLFGALEGVNQISYVQAWGITILCIILIRGPDRSVLAAREIKSKD